MIAAEAPDAVILATGSTPIILNLPGRENAEIMSAHELLAGADISAGTAAVIGGGLVGMEAAEYMAGKGIQVTVLEMKDEILTELGLLRNFATKLALEEEPVTVLTGTTVKGLEKGKVLAEGKEGPVEVSADLLVMAVGSRANDVSALESKCEELGIPCYKVGDAYHTPGLAIDAIHDAYNAVLKINGQL